MKSTVDFMTYAGQHMTPVGWGYLFVAQSPEKSLHLQIFGLHKQRASIQGPKFAAVLTIQRTVNFYFRPFDADATLNPIRRVRHKQG